MDHPNLSPEINRALAQSERDGGVDLRELPTGVTLRITTKNSVYRLRRGPDPYAFLIQGSPRSDRPASGTTRFSTYWFPCTVPGSTWGGSMIKVDFVGIGMRLEVRPGGHAQHTVLTSTIGGIEFEGTETA